MAKGKFYYFLIGSFMGVILAISLVFVGVKALRYYRQGEGLGYAKAYTKIIFEKVGASKSQVARFKSGGREQKIEVIKELILEQKERLPWVNREKRLSLFVSEKRSKASGYDVVIASSLDRIFPDGLVLQKPSVGRSVGLSAAKGEYEGFQVVVAGGENILKLVRLEFTDLKNQSSGSLIEQRNMGWRVVGSVPTEKPYYPVKYVGLWPDPLLPPQPVDVFPGVFQPFWVTLYVPRDAEAGMYRGAVKVFAGDALLTEIPLFLQAYNFTLPLESHLKTAFDLYPHITGSRYPKQAEETEDEYRARISQMNERYLMDMLLHRMNPILNIDPLSGQDMARVEQYRRFGLNNFSVGPRGGTFNNNWPQTDEEVEKLKPLYKEYSDNLDINGVLDLSYVYAWDEGEIGKPIVQKITRMLHEAAPGIKTMVCYHGFWDPLRHPGWGDDIDIWCFGIGDFDEAKINTLKDLGMEMWTYISGPGGSGYPNLAIDFDSIDYRIIPWLCWRHNIKGFLYWCVNWWPYADPFKTGMNTKWAQNGNGLLYYPGPNGPIDSLRIEIFRDGMEDYEYLYLLSERLQALKNTGGEMKHQDVIREADGLLKLDQKIAPSMTTFTRETRVLMEHRNKIAEMIERIDKILET